jgi:hypothetical protein
MIPAQKPQQTQMMTELLKSKRMWTWMMKNTTLVENAKFKISLMSKNLIDKYIW